LRFFTFDWWCGNQTQHVGDPSADYARHLDAIRDRLPSQLLAVQESVHLHDARLRQLVVLPAAASARLVLESYSGDERFALTYTGVERMESTADPSTGLRGPHGYGDLGYDEVDALPSGAFEHRLLFSTGIELVLVFRGFELNRERRV
jgi:hypothetical protein